MKGNSRVKVGFGSEAFLSKPLRPAQEPGGTQGGPHLRTHEKKNWTQIHGEKCQAAGSGKSQLECSHLVQCSFREAYNIV